MRDKKKVIKKFAKITGMSLSEAEEAYKHFSITEKNIGKKEREAEKVQKITDIVFLLFVFLFIGFLLFHSVPYIKSVLGIQ